MNEEEKVKKQLNRNMVWNLLAFAIVFCISGVVIYGKFSNFLYMSADSELKKAATQQVKVINLDNGQDFSKNFQGDKVDEDVENATNNSSDSANFESKGAVDSIKQKR